MKIWFINLGLDDDEDYDSGLPPWDQGYNWDDVGVYITLDDKKPHESSMPIISIQATYNMILEPKNIDDMSQPYFEEIPISVVTHSFYTQCISTVFENYN